MMSTGCAVLTPQPDTSVAHPKTTALTLKHAPAPISKPATANTTSNTDSAAQTTLPAHLPNELKKALQAQHQEWRGTRYRLGGMSRNGIDCSGFVHLTFQKRLGMNVPRDTGNLVRQGRDVAKKDLQIGDLVFFRTGRSNHVGIYMDNGQFMHASTRQGVKISRMGDAYWTRTYWKAKRLDLSNSQQLAHLQ